MAVSEMGGCSIDTPHRKHTHTYICLCMYVVRNPSPFLCFEPPTPYNKSLPPSFGTTPRRVFITAGSGKEHGNSYIPDNWISRDSESYP